MDYIPIFIIVHNHLEILKKSVESYEKYIKTPIKIIFFDVASTYLPTLKYLSEKEKQGYTVYHNKINNHHHVLNAIKDYKCKHPELKYYVMTDPDIELYKVDGDILLVYTEILNKLNVTSVGPMLKIDDLPDFYPLKKYVIEWHTKQFWSKEPKTFDYELKKVKYIDCRTDTTFQLCHYDNIPSSFPHANSIRVYEPYSARHLDWYIDPNNLTPCQLNYRKTTTSISHYNNDKYTEKEINATKKRKLKKKMKKNKDV